MDRVGEAATPASCGVCGSKIFIVNNNVPHGPGRTVASSKRPRGTTRDSDCSAGYLADGIVGGNAASSRSTNPLTDALVSIQRITATTSFTGST